MKYTLNNLPKPKPLRDAVAFARLNPDENQMFINLAQSAGVTRSELFRFLVVSAHEQLTQTSAA